MGFLAGVSLPRHIAYRSRGGPSWSTTSVALRSGARETTRNWTDPVFHYDLRTGIRKLDDFHDIRDLALVSDGPANGFRMHDHQDFTSKPSKPDIHIGTPGDDVLIGVGDGSNRSFQLTKSYVFGSLTKMRVITKPVPLTTRVFFDGVEQLSGWSVDTETGVVLFTVAPSINVAVTAGFEFEVPVAFDNDMDTGFQPSLATFKAAEVPSIRLTEVVGDVTTPTRRYHGGGSSQEISATTSINFAMGAAIGLDPTAANEIWMPDTAALELGVDYFAMTNRTTNGSHTLTFKNHDGTETLWSAPASSEFECVIIDNLGTPKWIALGA